MSSSTSEPEFVRIGICRIPSEVLGVAPEELHDCTRLFHDLGMGGDAANDLLEGIHRRFGTSFREFDFESYFPGEHDAFWFFHLRRFKWVARQKKDLTLGHLIKVVQAGKWFGPDLPA